MTFTATGSDYLSLCVDAIRSQEKRLVVRAPSPAHDQRIRNAYAQNRDEKQIVALLENVFSNHTLTEFTNITRADVNITDLQTVSKWFHESYYVKPKLSEGFLAGGAQSSIDSFFTKIVRKNSSISANNNQFLVGTIGCGKTTFICNLIYTNAYRFAQDRIIPIRFDIDALLEHKIPAATELYRALHSQILSSIKSNRHVPSQALNYLTVNNHIPADKASDEGYVIESLAHLIGVVRDTLNYQLLLFIDNIDFLYHIGDRGVFARSIHSEQQAAYESIINLVRIFSRSDQLCANRGINVTYCVRSDTLEYMESKTREIPLDFDISALSTYIGYEHESAELSHASVVIDKRFEMIEDLASGIVEPTKRIEIIQQAKNVKLSYGNLLEQGSGKPALTRFRHMWNLSRHGLRDFIGQLNKFSWLEYKDSARVDINRRFVEQYSPSIVAYVLGGRRRYAQFTGDVPNLYLINAPAPSNEVAVPLEFKEPHFATFWLKRLILEYIVVSEGVYQNVETIVKVFTGSHKRAYSDNLVRYILGNLAQVPESECIEVEVGASGSGGSAFYVKRVRATKRGRFLVDNFADTFTYLQLVLDDWRLRLPRSLIDLFEYRSSDEDYGYLVAPPDEYGAKLKRILVRKAAQTVSFAVLLDEAREHERVIYPNVFRRVEAAGVRKLERNYVTTRVIREIDRLTAGIAYRDEVFGKYCGDQYVGEIRARVREALAEIFAAHHDVQRLCYDGGV